MGGFGVEGRYERKSLLMRRVKLLERWDPPEVIGGYWGWKASLDGLEVRFLGRPAAAQTGDGEIPERRCQVSQVHSAALVEAQPGLLGPADGILIRNPDLAAGVTTADCLPIVLDGGSHGVAVVHAGWRGLAAGILTAAAEALGGVEAAWIGPGIGPCCYEVGAEVAERIACRLPKQAEAQILALGSRDRPHLDLGLAAAFELEDRVGVVGPVELWRCCTRCHPNWLASYRRDGSGCGRNLTWAWWTTSDRSRKPRGGRSPARS